jgi:membrane-associated protease RseP (regulator of RpoE activity)
MIRLIREALARAGSLTADEENSAAALERLFQHQGPTDPTDSPVVKAIIEAAKAALVASAAEVVAAHAIGKAFDDDTKDFTKVLAALKASAAKLKAAAQALEKALP